ncbi:MAG: glycosyltransferase family 1 protein [bacterium]
MKIGIDARIIYKRGVGRYISNLVEHLLEVDKDNKYFLYLDEKSARLPENINENCVIRRLKTSQPFIFQQFALPMAAVKDKIDILHGTDNVIPYFPLGYKGKKVVTIHDTMYVRPLNIAILKPTLKQRSIDIYNKYSIPKSACQADRVITVSENSKKDIEKHIKIPSEKITVIYEAADKIYKSIDNKDKIQEVENKYGITKPYILISAAADTRKNTVRCLEAFAEFNRQTGEKYQLVITSIGKKELVVTNILEKISLLALEKCVIITGCTTDEEMGLLYNGALFFLFPSLWEGFGLQVLEAFACGLPVITSRGTSLNEISGNAAEFVEPESVQNILAAMIKVEKNSELRAQMQKNGLVQVVKFDWKQTALRTLEVYGGLQK